LLLISSNLESFFFNRVLTKGEEYLFITNLPIQRDETSKITCNDCYNTNYKANCNAICKANCKATCKDNYKANCNSFQHLTLMID
jgi:hypothetical protein